LSPEPPPLEGAAIGADADEDDDEPRDDDVDCAAAASSSAFALAAASASWRAFSAASSACFFATAASRLPRSCATRWSTTEAAVVTWSVNSGRNVAGSDSASVKRWVAASSAVVSMVAGSPMSSPDAAMSFCTPTAACAVVSAAATAARAARASGAAFAVGVL
jgi:hypothetical protein